MVLSLSTFISQSVHAQRKADIGIAGGTTYYMGDINHATHFHAPSYAAGLIYRYNFNPRNSLRFAGSYVSLKGDETDAADPFQAARGASFGSSLVDLNISTEFNFLPYETTKLRKNRYTPYISAGAGYLFILNAPAVQGDPQAESTYALSFAGGFKYNLTTRLSAGAEWSFRKTFSDGIDGVQNIGAENHVFFHNKDWYSIVGVFVTYKIFDWGLDCPAYDE